MATILFMVEVVTYIVVTHIILFHYYYTTNKYDIVTKIRIYLHLTVYNILMITAGLFYFTGMTVAFYLQFLGIYGSVVISAVYNNR